MDMPKDIVDVTEQKRLNDARAVPADARVPTIATVTEIARCLRPDRRRAREGPMAGAGALTRPTYETFRGCESSI